MNSVEIGKEVNAESIKIDGDLCAKEAKIGGWIFRDGKWQFWDWDTAFGRAYRSTAGHFNLKSSYIGGSLILNKANIYASMNASGSTVEGFFNPVDLFFFRQAQE